MRSLIVTIFLLATAPSLAWSPNPFSSFGARQFQDSVLSSADSNQSDLDESESTETPSSKFASRRALLGAASMQISLLGVGLAALPESTLADTPTIFKSGKSPIVAGAKPKDKGDVKGTRKDPDFLRSVADCRSQCQNTLGPDGLSKPKEDCLSECQDICCKTYEQCTFDIVPRI